MTTLSVNVNKVALLRNSRDIGVPSVTRAAQICVDAGVGGITVHPRPDQRHIRPSDVYELAEMLTVEFNIEGNPFAGPEKDYPGFLEIIRKVRPSQCTLVPDDPGQLTSDHGWNIASNAERLRPVLDEIRSLGVRISLFMDPDPGQMALAAECGADRIELYTEPYARAFESGDCEEAIEIYRQAAEAARKAGLGVNAGHDLNLENLARFCTIEGIHEVSIGHALISEALEMGLSKTVDAYLKILAG